MAQPLSDLTPSKQNARSSPLKLDRQQKLDDSIILDDTIDIMDMSAVAVLPSTGFDARLPSSAPSLSPPASSDSQSPRKSRSPFKYRLQDDARAEQSPPGTPDERTLRFNEGLTRAIDTMQKETEVSDSTTVHHDTQDEGMSTIYQPDSKDDAVDGEADDETEITLSIDKSFQDTTMGDLSTISAIPADMTRFATLRNSPTKASYPGSPSKQMRSSVMNTPGTAQRPLQLLSSARRSTSPDDDATPRRPRGLSTSPDLLNFTGTTNILIPPPGSAPRTARRTPSGRAGFPIRINPSPTHRSQASVDRERSAGLSPNKPIQSYFPEHAIPATPSNKRQSMYANGFGPELLDLDLEPMATPRSIPTVTPRELETLRSELQSKISGLEATLSGKEAEVMALKRSITDAEVRVGKTSEELRNERGEKEQLSDHNNQLEARNREMEQMLRELKQNAFVDEREREKLRRQAEDAERRAEEQEVKILELNASLDTLRNERMKGTSSPGNSNEPATPGQDVDKAVKNATETVAKELHALYKSKHERKVADLKTSYEKRWTKQVEQLRADLESAENEITKLQSEKEATMSGVIPGQSDAVMKMEGQVEELRRWNEEVQGEKKVLEAEIAGLKGQINTLAAETDSLRRDVEAERIEKGELVAQVDLFLTMSAQAEEKQTQAQQPHSQPVSPPRSEDGMTTSSGLVTPSKFRTSVNGGTGGRRPMSMLQKPTAGKFSGIPPPGSVSKAPGSGTGSRLGYARSGGLMDGIARMGAGGR